MSYGTVCAYCKLPIYQIGESWHLLYSDEDQTQGAVMCRKRDYSMEHEPTPAEQPRHLWPVCDWCGTELEKQASGAGKCPKCGAMKFVTVAASPAEGPRQDQEWRNLPIGHWFFSDSPICANRYSVMERTDSGCTAVCSSPWHHQGAAQDLREIARLHNESLAAQPSAKVEEIAAELCNTDWNYIENTFDFCSRNRRNIEAILRPYFPSKAEGCQCQRPLVGPFGGQCARCNKYSEG